jgi:transposase
MSTSIDYVGLDVHKKVVAVCVKTVEGQVLSEETLAATRPALTQWAAQRERPWVGALEATLFTGWIYDHLRPHARELKVAHPLMLRAIVAAKKTDDRISASTIADLLRADLLPECTVAPREIRELRQVLRYRGLVVRQLVQMKNKTAGLLMEAGVEYNKRRLHGKAYFAELLGSLEDLPASVVNLLGLSRGTVEFLSAIDKRLVRALRRHRLLAQRVERLMTIDAVGEIVALTWALEIGDPRRFASARRAVSYCGLCTGLMRSAGKDRRGPISKQRNKHLQSVLIEAAKLAPRHNTQLAAVHAREIDRGHRNRATLAVARKLVAYLLAVDKSGQDFEPRV